MGESLVTPISECEVRVEGVCKLLSSLKTNKASGPDEVPCRILKQLADDIAPSLCYPFNQSLTQGTVPDDWKKAKVTPIFKKGNIHLPENYRPVSLTCICCKLLEHIVCSNVRSHLDSNNILSSSQHGFRSCHSCESQLLITLHDFTTYWEKKEQVDVAVLDFAKAFDTVPHKKLPEKLKFYGIGGNIHSWISSFLVGREQCVVVDGEASSNVPVESGVPQGTVLGPLLFLIHINDLPQAVNSEVRLFADDCLLYRLIKSVDDQAILQQDLKNLEEWGRLWGMRFNAAKCNILRVTRTKKPLTRMYTLCGHVLEQVSDAKWLGINISSELSWTPHIESICHKATNTLSFLRRNLHQCPAHLKEQAYIALVRSVLEYAAAVWDPYKKGDIAKWEKVQRSAARFMKNDHERTSSVTKMLRTRLV